MEFCLQYKTITFSSNKLSDTTMGINMYIHIILRSFDIHITIDGFSTIWWGNFGFVLLMISLGLTCI